MAISTRAAGTWADAGTNGTSQTLTIPSGAAAGDLMIAVYVTKPYTADPTIDQGWSLLYKGQSGTTANGNGAGSQEHAVFYKEHTGTESNPTVTIGATSSPGGGVIVVLQKASNETWMVGQLSAVGEQAMGSTALSIALTTTAALQSGDWVFALTSAGDDSATFTRATTAISGGPTWNGNYVEYPTTHLSTTTGNDAAMDLGYRVTSGTASSGSTITVTATLSAAERAAASLFYVRVAATTTNSGSVTADATISKTFAGSFTGDAYIKATIEGSVTANAYLQKTLSGSASADAYIQRTFAGSVTADAYIGGTGVNAPTWVSPEDGATINATPTLVFTIPTGPAGNYHFHLQLDTANTFDTGNLRELKTNVSQTGWEYHNGSTWVAFPSGGVASTYAGNQCRHTVQSALTSGTWYRRVRGGM